MQQVLRRYREAFADPYYLRSLAEGILLYAASMGLIFYAINFATRKAGNFVEDIVLSNIPAYDTRFLFVYGTFTLILLSALVLLAHPNRLPFALKAIGLFFIVRSVFISVTHLGPFPLEEAPLPAPILNSMFFGGDQFFSAHTGLPFLGAPVFWHIRSLRYLFLGASLFFATIVLLGHYHYSIDVLAAFFITYGVYQIVEWLFPRDRSRFLLDK